jgi:hypothetical protein
MAIAPAGSDDEDEDNDAGGELEERWVPGRVLGERTHRDTKQYKISLDGYDSEDDAWVDADDPRVRPYEVSGGGGGADKSADEKEQAKLAAQERDRARKFNEQRKGEARSAHRVASGK